MIAPEERTETELLGSNRDREQIVVAGTLLGFDEDAERCEARLNLAHLEVPRHLRESAHETRLGMGQIWQGIVGTVERVSDLPELPSVLDTLRDHVLRHSVKRGEIGRAHV